MKRFLFALMLLKVLTCAGQDTTQYNVRFSSDESRLIKAQLKALDRLISNLEGPVNAFEYDIQGHTDNVGDRLYNLQLSERRCQSIKNFLIKKGVKENRITFEKYSFDLPLAENTTEEGRASNRRATLTIVFKLDNPDWRLKPQAFQIDPKKEIIIRTKNGCKIGIPANAFESSDLLPVTGEVEIQVTEYNNPADFIASGIPMSYNASGRLFMYHSYEMLNVKAFKNSTPLYLKNDVSISLNCKKVDSLYVSGFYKFDLREQRWFEDTKTETIKATVIEEEKTETKPEPEPVSRAETKSDNQDKKTETIKPEIKEETKETKPEVILVPETLAQPGKQDETKARANKAGEITKIEPDTSYVISKKKIKKIKIEKPVFKSGAGDSIAIVKLDTLAPVGRCCNPKKICPCLRAHVQDGLITSEHDLATSFDTSGTKYFDQRYSDFSYSGTDKMPPGTHLSNQKYFPVKLKTKKLFLRKKAAVQLKFNKEKNPELKDLKKIKWKLRFSENSEDYDSFRKRKFSDIRIQYDPFKKEAVLELKEQDKFCTVTLKAKDPESKLDEKMKNYTSALARRKKRFDREEHNEAITTVNLFYQRYKCFRYFRSILVKNEEYTLNLKSWLKYFNEHRTAIHAEYVFLHKNIDSILEPYCKEGEVKFLLKAAGIDRFLLIGLGIYNYDQVIAVEDVVSIESPIFLTKKGRRINVKESFLILDNINGMIHLDSNAPLKLIEKSRNTLFIVDKSNRRFKVVMEANEDLQSYGNSFIMQDITSTTEDLKGLEKELMEK